jgi:ClpX C4-type zinc finger
LTAAKAAPIVRLSLTTELDIVVLRVGKPKLRCSFCGKSDAQVSRLLAAAKGFICDVCIGVCNKILEAVPATFAGWPAMTDDELLGYLKPALATVEATRQVLQAQIDELRQRGVSWELIGRSLGVSRQAAWERFS